MGDLVRRGKVSIAHNCAHRWAETTPDAIACVSLGEDDRRRTLTFAEMSDQVTRLAEALAALGVGVGDRVAIFLPMSQEVAVASHACAHLGAVQVPIFSGFAAPAVAQRLRHWKPRSRSRRGARCGAAGSAHARDPGRGSARGARARARRPGAMGRAARRAARRPAAGGSIPRRRTCSRTRPGRPAGPKGVVHVQGGFLVSIAREVCYQADARSGVIHFATDMGWIMGPWTVVGGHALGATLVFAEGAPISRPIACGGSSRTRASRSSGSRRRSCAP